MSRVPRVLFVGVGGLGAPAAMIMARAGAFAATYLDDDIVDITNLHRQVLFADDDVGASKAEVAAAKLGGVAVRGRLSPGAANDYVSAADLVLEGSDNFPTKFLANDAARLAGKPCVQAGVVGLSGWVLAHDAGDGACLRCVFEDIPTGPTPTCDQNGVLGPVVGVVASLQAALALRMLAGDSSASGELWSYDAKRQRIGRRRIHQRADCPTCSGVIRDLRAQRYAAHCAA